MPDIILTDEQTRLVYQAQGAIIVRDMTGQSLGRMERELTSEVIAELKRRAASRGPWYRTEQVQNRLQVLQEEWDRLGGFDETHARELMKRLNAADPGSVVPKERA